VPIKKRLTVATIVLILVLTVYGTVKLYSPALIFYVVEQTLIQKAPPGTNPAHLHERLQLLVFAGPNPEARMEELFRISGYLEKVQTLTPDQLELLLKTPLSKSNFFRKDRGAANIFHTFLCRIGTFFSFGMSDNNGTRVAEDNRKALKCNPWLELCTQNKWRCTKTIVQ
jgi:hypothetical protein